MNIKTDMFNKPGIIGVIGDINTGKSMLLYHLLEENYKTCDFDLFYYGLRLDFKKVKSQRIYSVAELESIQNSLIVIDEVSSLFDLDNRKIKKSIENTLRLINHNNNIVVICGTPENFKKFLSAKVDKYIFKKCSIADFINGSVAKNRLLSYNGYERGTELLNLVVNEAMIYDGKHYSKINIPYYKIYDNKKGNVSVLRNRPKKKVLKKDPKSVPKNVPENVQGCEIKVPFHSDNQERKNEIPHEVKG